MEDQERLTRVEIRRFRGLSALALDDLGMFNVLLGANDVGKTSVLEAIFLLSGCSNPRLPIRVQNRRNFLVHDMDQLTLLFKDLDLRRAMELSADSTGAVARRTLRISIDSEAGTETVSRHPNGGNGGVRRVRDAERRIDESSSVGPNGRRIIRLATTVEPRRGDPSLLEGTIRDEDGQFRLTGPGDPADRHTIPAWYLSSEYAYDSEPIAAVIVHKKADTLVRYLRVINRRVETIVVVGNVAYLDVGLAKLIPLNMFGSGMVRAAIILSLCILDRQEILLIDEIENGLHHAALLPLLESLLKLSAEQGIQVFATTHSIGILESLSEVLEKDSCSLYRETTNCYTLQRDKNGLVRSYRYAYEQFEHCIRQGIEIR